MSDTQTADPEAEAHRVLNEAIDSYQRNARLDAPFPVLSTTQEVWDAIVDGAKRSGNWIADPECAGITEYRGCRVEIQVRYGMWAKASAPLDRSRMSDQPLAERIATLERINAAEIGCRVGSKQPKP